MCRIGHVMTLGTSPLNLCMLFKCDIHSMLKPYALIFKYLLLNLGYYYDHS